MLRSDGSPRTDRRRVALFIAVTFAFSWVQWLAVIASQRGLIPFSVSVTALPIFGPLVGATAVRNSPRSHVDWRLRPTYGISACVLSPLMFVTALAAASAFATDATRLQIPGLSTIATVAVGMFVTAGVGEEPGWRGFLLPELRKSMSAVNASAIVAMTWFAWHLPLFWIAGSSQSTMPVLTFALGIASYTFIITWLVEASSSRMLIAMLFHSSANATFWVAMVTLKGTPQEQFVTTTYIGIIVAVAMVAATSMAFRRIR